MFKIFKQHGLQSLLLCTPLVSACCVVGMRQHACGALEVLPALHNCLAQHILLLFLVCWNEQKAVSFTSRWQVDCAPPLRYAGFGASNLVLLAKRLPTNREG